MVISHLENNGQEKPVAFASRSLTKTKRGYAQIEREALAIIFGVHKFHQYLYGREVILQTDHKPLTTILGPKTAIPTLSRMQRWALILLAYQYKIEYRQSSQNANADAMSRLPVGDATPEPDSGMLCSF